MYVATERNNSDNGVSRPAILQYDVTAAGTTLTATNEWNLTADLPPLGANLGIEGITWVPDAFLVSHSFFDVRGWPPVTIRPSMRITAEGSSSSRVEGTGFVYRLRAQSHDERIQADHIDFHRIPGWLMALQLDGESVGLWANLRLHRRRLADIFADRCVARADPGTG